MLRHHKGQRSNKKDPCSKSMPGWGIPLPSLRLVLKQFNILTQYGKTQPDSLSAFEQQRPGWPNSQLSIRNLFLCDVQTLWLLVIIFKTCSDQILAKLINQGGCAAALFASRRPKNLQNEKNFLCLEIAEIGMGGQFWVEKNDSGHKNSFFES